jgi:hypothetical protein
LVPTVGITATGFCYPGKILQLFSLTISSNFVAADSSNQIASRRVIFISAVARSHLAKHQVLPLIIDNVFCRRLRFRLNRVGKLGGHA